MRSWCTPAALPPAVPLPHIHLPAAEPPATAPSQEELKRIAAHKAVEQVTSNMVVGLGTGSTAHHAIERIGELLRSGAVTNVVGIPTSTKTESHARSLGIPLVALDANTVVDLSIDGADEVDPALNLVKGRGGSLLREKMIEGASRKFVVIVDESKLVDRIGASRMAVPVEVTRFGWKHTLGRIKGVFDRFPGCQCVAKLRTLTLESEGEGEGESETLVVPAETDNLNYVVDLFFEEGIRADLNLISDELLRITGVVEHGMFLGLATSVIVAGKNGVSVINKAE